MVKSSAARKFYIHNMDSTAGNCGIYDLHDFDQAIIGRGTGKNITDEEWMIALYNATMNSLGGWEERFNLPPIVLFSGNEEQSYYKFSPQGFAGWLKSKNENVLSTAEVKNPGSGMKIQAFLWTPSNEFRKMFKSKSFKVVEGDEE